MITQLLDSMVGAAGFEPANIPPNYLITLKLISHTVCLLYKHISHFIFSAIKFFVSAYRINTYKKGIAATDCIPFLHFGEIKND